MDNTAFYLFDNTSCHAATRQVIHIVMRKSRPLPVKANGKTKVRNGASQIPLDQDVPRFDVPVGNGWFRSSALYFCVEVRYSSGSGMGKINLKN